MLKLISLITGRKIVLLLDHEGQIRRTIELKRPNKFTGTKCCYVYWYSKIRLINLLKEGKISGASYIVKWAYE
jgi:hypothetical protein